MAAQDPRIGIEPQGNTKRVWPKKTISGNNYDRRKMTQFRGIGGGRFVIMDNQFPSGFDVEAVINELTGAKAEKAK